MRYMFNGQIFWRIRLAVHSFCRRYANFNVGQYQLEHRFSTYGRRNYRSRNHLLFALSYAAVSSTSSISSTSNDFAATDIRQLKCYNPLPDQIEELKWEKVVHDDNVCVYRRWIDSLGVYEYRCAGTYTDISANNFFQAQMNIDYRKEWDPNVLHLTLLEQCDNDSSEVLRWVHKFPRPLNARIYIYKRRTLFDSKAQSMHVDSEAMGENEWPNDPADKSYVRVTTYKSRLSLFAHSKFTEKGFDYVLTYYDLPKAAIPGPAYNWIVNYGGHYFLKDVHAAAKKLATQNVS